MSKNIHITSSSFNYLTNIELNEQFEDPNSELAEW